MRPGGVGGLSQGVPCALGVTMFTGLPSPVRGRCATPKSDRPGQPVHVDSSSCSVPWPGEVGTGPWGEGAGEERRESSPGGRGLCTCENRGGSGRTTACPEELLGVESLSWQVQGAGGHRGPITGQRRMRVTPSPPGVSFLMSQTLTVLRGGCGFVSSARECPQGAGVCSARAQAPLACPAQQSRASQMLGSEH